MGQFIPNTADLLSFRRSQSLSNSQKVQAQANLGVDQALDSSLLASELNPVVVDPNSAVTGVSTGFALASSTFSGHGSTIGVQQNFDTISFRFKPHDANFLPTLVRVRVHTTTTGGTVLGSLLADVIVPVSCELNVPCYVQCQLGQNIANAGAVPLYVEFFANGRCGYENISPIISDLYRARYSTDGSILTINTVANSSPVGLFFRIENTGARNLTNTGLPNANSSATSSTFNAWGCPVGILPKFNRLQFILSAFDAAFLPTQCRVRIRQVNHSGSIIATALVAVSYTAVGRQVVTVDFPSDVDPAGSECWFEFACDGRVAFGLISTAPFPFPTYPKVRYNTTASCEATPTIESSTASYIWLKTILLDRSRKMQLLAGSLIRLIRKYGGGGSSTTPFIPACGVSLPSRIPAVEGFETNIYWDGLIRTWLPNSLYNIDVACTKGRQDSNRWRYTPVNADAGTTPIVVTVEFNNTTHAGLIPVAVTSSLITKANTFGAGVTRKVLVIGDSTTATGRPTQQILDNLAADSTNYAVTLLGTQGTGANKHEGRSGRTVNWFYTDAASPFVFSGAFNFASYLSTNGYTMSSGDSVFILLGINDVFSIADDTSLGTLMATMATQLNAMIVNMQAAVAGLKVWIGLTIPPAREQDAFGVDYAAGVTRARYAWNAASWREFVILNFDNRTGSNVYVAPIGLALDTVNNMQTVTEAANARNATTVVRQSNGLHPAASGDYQIGDCLYSCLASVET